MMHATKFGIAAAAAGLLLVGTAAQARAQTMESPKEYGIDAGVQFGLGNDSFTAIGIPAQRLRIGFFRSPTVSFEPYGGLTYRNSPGSESVTNLNLGAGLLYHLSPNRTDNQIYVRPFAQVNYINGSGNSDTQFGIGGGLGVKMPWRDRLATRLEAAIGYEFASDNFDSGATLNLLAGLSFFSTP